jgi:hypothetical protein
MFGGFSSREEKIYEDGGCFEAFVHCDVVGLVALDFILRVFLARMVGILL